MSVDFKIIGKRIKQARKNADITQEKLSELMNVSTGYISQIERGITKPNLVTLDAICSHINCDLVYIISGISLRQDIQFNNDFYTNFSKLSSDNRHIIIELMEIMLKESDQAK